jgi:hypothetical protein
MSKFFDIPDGDFTIKTAGGSLTLGADGTATLDGNLLVEGENFSLQTTDLEVQDNIIVINKGEVGVGISRSSGTAGIEIDRGTLPNARIIFDETIPWTDPGDDENPIEALTTEYGGFTFTNTDGELVGIKVNAIATAGETLNLIGSGVGRVSVAGTTNYELNLLDDDDIPNKKYVDDAVLGQVGLSKISKGDITESSVEVFDQETSGLDSRVEVRIDGTLTTTFLEDTVEIQRVEFEGNEVKAVNSGEDLVLTHSATTSVRVNHVLSITANPNPLSLPTNPTNGVKLFAGPQQIGGTGIFFANQDGVTDELVSRSKSILYGIIF